MSDINLKEIIAIIPDILQYFVSGSIFVLIYRTVCSKKIEPFMHLVWSCVISFVWVSLIRTVNELWLRFCWLDSLWVVVSISIALSIIVSVALSMVLMSKWFRRLTVFCFGISPHSSVWRNVANGDSAYLKVYLKSKDFYWAGSLYSYEENGNESWICIHKPVKYNNNNTMLYTQGDNENAYLAFNLKDVESVELFN